MMTLQAIAKTLGGHVCGREVLAPTPGHSNRDRGLAIRLVPGAPDGLLVACFNGGWHEIAMAKDALRNAGVLPGRHGQRRELTDAEREAIARAELEREWEKAEAHASAAVDAQQRLSRARPADPAHPYLAGKRIPAERLGQAGAWLLVPMQDETGKVWNIQRIAPAANDDGRWPKIYLKGSRTHGLFWWAGKPFDRLVIGEGMGTVAAVRRATGLPVVAAMTADNLPRVASMIRARQPNLPITIAADDDPKGIQKAREAASLVGASIACPGEMSR